MKLWLKITLGVLLLIIIFVLRTLWNSGLFTKIEPHFEGKVTEIKGFNGAEDITIDKSTGLALVSSSKFTENAPDGAIFLLNLKEETPTPVKLTDNLPFTDFHPHGISLYQSPEGQKLLFVVNHHLNLDTSIEIFQFTDSSLVHKETIKNDLFISPNDIVGVGERQFYLTNDHDEKKSSWRSKKDLLQIPMGNVCYFDGNKANIVADGFLYANGINVSQDGKKLFVAATTGKRIKIFDRDITSGKLTENSEIVVNGADNIELDESGDLWVGCHPKLLAFLAHSKDHSKLSPSEVVKISFENEKPTVESIYLNDGSPLSGSSVSAVWRNKMLIGSVFGDKVLLCSWRK
ncbi:SMP-30/gluconolactonase/LRE family protein [Emticicia sp. BO119]|uniref:SMP-30/gluconolactonase/LRE family protein n=1 Tax=Emticicia sp. BO119 TaxID=2757768 RepID=UPI0015F11559|nr:SMP-30/gluconolactonase/LRE family protein [Emticicia sp. BO119]MBA4852489.1 SMP-30/gluconolactonase/LRE family protein [Emticicia sp. BO119]